MAEVLPEPNAALPVLGNYVLETEIGHGSHGKVYRGYRAGQPERPVAVKLIDDSANLDTTLLEPELLSQLHQPNIVRLEDYFLLAGRVVLVMEYVPGGTLEDRLAVKGRFTPVEVRDVLLQIASALAHAHDSVIIHGDVKPSNILVDHERFVLADFGVSRISQGMQLRSRMVGTYFFMAPEQLRGRPRLESDAWALGAVAYLLLTGRKPFDGDDIPSLAKSILWHEPVPPSGILPPDAPGLGELESLILNLLEKDPLARMSLADLIAELSGSKEARGEVVAGSVRPSAGTQPSAASGDWAAGKRRERKQQWSKFWVRIAWSTLPDLIIGDLFTMLGAMLLFRAHTTKTGPRRFFLAFLAMAVGATVTLYLASLIDLPVQATRYIGYYVNGLVLLALPFLVRARSIERELFLMESIRNAALDQEKILEVMKDYVDSHRGDLNLQERYTQALIARGRYEEAIVEARLMLKTDPYNFSASLMLADAYLEVGLAEECLGVCRSYLAVSGQCFEFTDLAAVAQAQLEVQRT